MKKLAFITIATLLLSVAQAKCNSKSANVFSGAGSNASNHYVQGHYSKDLRYTHPYFKTNPDSTQLNNYNTKNNYNFHNGQTGKNLVSH